MNKSIVAGVVLGGCTTLGYAQDHVADISAAGGHDIAVFTGVPLYEHAGGAGNSGKAGKLSGGSSRIHGLPGAGAGTSAGAGAGFVLGHQYRFEHLMRADVGDPLHNTNVGKAASLVNQDGRLADTGVNYYNSRIDRHVSADSSWTADTLGGNGMANRAWGMSIGADYGNVSLRAAHQNRHVAPVQLFNRVGTSMAAKNSIIAANLHTRWGTAYAAYAANRGWGSSPLYNPDNPYGAGGVASVSSTDSRDTLVGVAVPMTRSTTFLASLIRKNDRDLANRDANQFAVGASYVVSRKTDFYAALSHTVNTSSAGILISDAARPNGSSAINVGMRHAF